MTFPMPLFQPIFETPKLWLLHEDFSIEVIVNGIRYRITMHHGFKTDGQTIPRIFWIITGHPFEGDGMVAALFHDGLYGSELLPRETADLIYKILAERYKMNRFRAMMRYRFLRTFGGLTWSTHTDATRAEARKFIKVYETHRGTDVDYCLNVFSGHVDVL